MGKKSKNLKEAKERFKQACKNKDPKEIAIASAEAAAHDPERGDIFTCGILLYVPILKKLKSGEIKLSKMTSKQIRDFVIQEWERLEIKQEEEGKPIMLSQKQEREVINTSAGILRGIKKHQQKG